MVIIRMKKSRGPDALGRTHHQHPRTGRIPTSDRRSEGTRMVWYDRFNLVEAALWVVVALAVLFRTSPVTPQQRWGVALGGAAFVLFGGTDLLEIGCAGFVPLWLWVLKIACGCAILA